MHRMIVGAACAALALANAALAANLSVTVSGLRSDKGQVLVGLFRDKDGFPETRRLARQHPASAGEVTLEFTDLEPGAWAVAAVHDADGDGRLGKGLFGIPIEGYGFSNGARGVFGPPDFADAVIELPAEGTSVAIPLKY